MQACAAWQVKKCKTSRSFLGETMAIAIEHEDVEGLKKWGMGLEKLVENCLLCQQPTRYWSVVCNCPVCEECAKTKDEADAKAAFDAVVAHRG